MISSYLRFLNYFPGAQLYHKVEKPLESTLWIIQIKCVAVKM